MENNILTHEIARKVPMTRKLAFAMADFAKSIAVAIQVIFQLYFYTTAAGLKPTVAAMIILIAKIWDIIDDFIIGYLLDKTKSKEGRCRHWIKLVTVPAGVVITLLFFIPELSGTGKIIWIAIIAILQVMFNSALVIPLNALHARLTTDPLERTKISQVKSILSQISMQLIAGVTLPFVMSFGADQKKGWLVLGVIYGILFIICNYIAYFGTKGYEPVDEETSIKLKIDTNKLDSDDKNYLGLIDTLKVVLGNAPWLITICAYFINCIGGCLLNASMAYYYQYNLKNVGLMATASTVSLCAVFLAIAFMGISVKKFGTIKTAIIGVSFSICGLLLRTITHDATPTILLIGYGVANFGEGLYSSMLVILIFDAMTYGEWKTGIDCKGVLMSGYTMAYKLGMALGTPFAGLILGIVGFNGSIAEQSEKVLNMIFYMNVPFQVICSIICLVVILFNLKYKKIIDQINEENRLKAEAQA